MDVIKRTSAALVWNTKKLHEYDIIKYAEVLMRRE